jgi:hypothetical protein
MIRRKAKKRDGDWCPIWLDEPSRAVGGMVTYGDLLGVSDSGHGQGSAYSQQRSDNAFQGRQIGPQGVCPNTVLASTRANAGCVTTWTRSSALPLREWALREGVTAMTRRRKPMSVVLNPRGEPRPARIRRAIQALSSPCDQGSPSAHMSAGPRAYGLGEPQHAERAAVPLPTIPSVKGTWALSASRDIAPHVARDGPVPVWRVKERWQIRPVVVTVLAEVGQA